MRASGWCDLTPIRAELVESTMETIIDRVRACEVIVVTGRTWALVSESGARLTIVASFASLGTYGQSRVVLSAVAVGPSGALDAVIE